ncbi:MAG: hypothetical protein ACTSXQ_08160 [Alphaproteobacteria bacterium]
MMNKNTKITIGTVIYKNTIQQIDHFLLSLNRAMEKLSQASNVSLQLSIYQASEREEVDNLCQKYPYIKNNFNILNNNQNIGFGKAHNLLIASCFNNKNTYYIGANPDGSFHPDCLLNLVKEAKKHKKKALIEAIQAPLEHPKTYNDETNDTEWISGACFLLSDIIYKKIGGFDKNIFMYCEDVDLSWRARLEGFSLKTCANAWFWHDTSNRKEKKEAIQQMYISFRYLAQKWNQPDIVESIEKKILRKKIFKDIKELPDITKTEIIHKTKNIPDFSHQFHFSDARW